MRREGPALPRPLRAPLGGAGTGKLPEKHLVKGKLPEKQLEKGRLPEKQLEMDMLPEKPVAKDARGKGRLPKEPCRKEDCRSKGLVTRGGAH